ncbi:hypothetical protein PISMIDRAFT_683767 [Pisolithus microcarpus 441]|uniref:Uncharacterized protein n=1 Tax=Pisolithus microcarpus 441 TaxID=765257 RepID=A0A0C9Z908_9AGAM|nr:hypothetical protein PISMIDRAFT_683767 [Pisolithus microcarpus 441]
MSLTKSYFHHKSRKPTAPERCHHLYMPAPNFTKGSARCVLRNLTWGSDDVKGYCSLLASEPTSALRIMTKSLVFDYLHLSSCPYHSSFLSFCVSCGAGAVVDHV